MKRLCLFLGRLKFHLNMDAFKKKFVNLFKIFFYPVILILWRILLCFMIQFYFYLDDCIHTPPESPWILLFTKLTGSAGLQNSGKTKQNKTRSALSLHPEMKMSRLLCLGTTETSSSADSWEGKDAKSVFLKTHTPKVVLYTCGELPE